MFYSSLPQPICLNPFGTGQCLSTEVPDWTVPSSIVSIPLEQGSVFRQKCQIGLCRPQLSQSLWNRAVSFDIQTGGKFETIACLNPFGTGQCLSTDSLAEIASNLDVSIPLEQGSVFRLYLSNWKADKTMSQSLWNRAVSFDLDKGESVRADEIVSIPLEQGSVFRLQWCFEALWHKACESHFPTFSETQRVGS